MNAQNKNKSELDCFKMLVDISFIHVLTQSYKESIYLQYLVKK